jgi:hypothetical protein
MTLGASERSLEKACNQTKKALANKKKRARHSATIEATPYISGWFKKVL